MKGPRESGERERGAPSFSLGFLAALPLFLAYEIGFAAQDGSAGRAAAERLLNHVLFLFEDRLQVARVLLLATLAVLAWIRLGPARDTRGGVAPGLARQVGLGILTGLLLGPVLLGLQGWLTSEDLGSGPVPPRSLASLLRLVGAAPWEELLFRVGLYGATYLAVRQLATFLGLESRLARFASELVALLGSAVLFAAFHLEAVQHLLAASGEPFHRGLFLWRVSAGILLAALFRWRGFGVAAWAHAVYNLGLALGIRP